tara:strand:- start:162 stop:560 length:399 start_codon:yes stop_codon:yes gene_type:complete
MKYICLDFSSICLCCDRISPELEKPRDCFSPGGKHLLGQTTFPTIEQQNHHILDKTLSLLQEFAQFDDKSQNSIGVRIILPTAKDLKQLINSISSHTDKDYIRKCQKINLLEFDNRYDDKGNELYIGYGASV